MAPATMGWFFFRFSVEGKSLQPAARFAAIYPQPGDAPPAGVDAVEKARHHGHPLPAGAGLGLVSASPGNASGRDEPVPRFDPGGSYRAEMPPGCEVVYAVVYNPALTGDEVMAQIRSVIDGVVAADTWLREHPPRIDYPVIHRVLDPVNLPLDHEAVEALKTAYRGALGREPDLGCLPRPCDANIMTGAGETTVIFGPGDLADGAHGTNEFVPIDQVVAACKVYANLIVDWCGVTPKT